jgi:F0F1-type ATP synthase membrane subunit c/vacuolar-type H+-ATPase subunit K
MEGYAVAQVVEALATSRKVAGSIFIYIILPAALYPWDGLIL